MRTALTSALFFSMFFITANLLAQDSDQFARNSKGNGDQITAGTDTLSQQMVLDYGLANILDGVAVVTGSDSIVLHPVIKGKAEMVGGNIVFKQFSDIVILPNTQGVIIPGSVQKSGNKVIRFKVSFWKPDAQGPRDDLFLTYVPTVGGKGEFVFEPTEGAKVKLGLYDYTVTDGSDSPLTLKVEKKTSDPNTAPGRKYAPPKKQK